MIPEVFRLSLPSRPEHLGTARSFAAAVARHYEVAGESVEDVKIAISEACVDALVVGEPLNVHAHRDGDLIRFEVDAPAGEGDPERASLDTLGHAARVELIGSLFPGAETATVDGRRTVRFWLSLG